MQVPIINGIYADVAADFRTSYPVNLVPVPKSTGIAKGYLKLAKGIAQFAATDQAPKGIDRGGINWNGACYRVIGELFVRVENDFKPPTIPIGSATTLAHVANGTQVTFDYSFDCLGIAVNGVLRYWDGASLTSVTDPDIGTVIDVVWIDGYWMTTDGANLVVTDLNDRYSVNPLRYGSSEIDPDPVVALKKVRNEVNAVNRYTIEVFQNVGGTGFPFERIDGAMIPKGAIGTHACCVYLGALAFLGSARNEEPSLYIANQGQAQKIATREIEQILHRYTEEQLSKVVMEQRAHDMHQHLYIHLPDLTIVYDAAASQEVGEPVFAFLTSGSSGDQPYRARNFVWCYDRWICGDTLEPARIGYLTDNLGTQYGNGTFYEFGTMAVYNEGRPGILHSLELVFLNGWPEGTLPAFPRSLSHSYSVDGLTWSQERFKEFKNPKHHLQWRNCGKFENWRVERFRGIAYAPVSFAFLNAEIEALNG